MRDKREKLRKAGVLRKFLWVLAIMTGFLLTGYFTPHSAYAGHTTPGAWAEYPDIIYCVHCHQQIIVSGNPDGTDRTIVSSPSITGTSRATHTKRADWTSTVSSMLSKCGSACSGSSASAIAGYYNAYYCTTCTAPYYYITATPASNSATVTYTTGYSSSGGQACYGTSPGSMTTCVSESTSGTSHSVSLTGLTASTTYYYKILFTDSTGRSFDTSAPGASTFTTLAQLTPNPPSNLTAQVQGWINPSDYTTINLTWQDNSTNETGFEIERNGSYLTTVGAGVTTYSDPGLATATTYSYRVTACNANGCSPYTNTVSAITGPDTTPPTAPGMPSILPLPDGTSLSLSWGAASDPESGIAYYIVYRDSVPISSGGCANPTGTTCTDTGLTENQTYTYEISAVNPATLEGPKSPSAQGTPVMAAVSPPLWSALYNGTANLDDIAVKVATDPAGNIYVTGYSQNGTTYDYLTIKYDSTGNLLWSRRYDNGKGDYPTSLAVDNSGNVYVTGRSHTSVSVPYFDYATIKYDTNGTQLWVARYNGPPGNMDDIANKVVVDSAGNVYVTGWSQSGTTFDYATVKYDSNGTQLWVARYDYGKGDFTPDVAVDGSGNVYVTGWSSNGTNYDLGTVKYDPSGNQLWVVRYDNLGNDYGYRVAVDASGNLVVGGSSSNGSNSDYVVLKYDTNGNPLWTARYDNGDQDNLTDLKIDSAGNVYVTGTSNTSPSTPVGDVATVKYDSNGNQLWAVRYDKGGSDTGVAIAVDPYGNVHVGGIAYNGVNNDYLMLKYDAAGNRVWVATYDNGGEDGLNDITLDNCGDLIVTGKTYNGSNFDYGTLKYAPPDVSVNRLWVARYNGPANADDVGAKAVVDRSGNVYVTGWSYNGTNYDYLTIKYDPTGTKLWEARYDAGRGDFAPDVAVDGSGNVYVTGWSYNTATSNNDALTIKYDQYGTLLWARRYDNGGDDAGFRILVDSSGNVYVAGNSSNGSNNDYLLLKYDTNGNQLWTVRYNNGNSEGVNSMALDNSGNIYVTGWSNDGSGIRDYATVKYDTNGNQLWAARYNGPANQNDVAVQGVPDSSGNVYMTGWSFNGTNYDYATIKEDPAGNQLWAARYDGGRGDFAPDVAVDGSGNAYVTGWSYNTGTANYDAVTIKYDTNGNLLWTATYNNVGDDAGFRIVADSQGNVVVAGNSSNGLNNDYFIIKYDTSGNQIWLARYDNGGIEGLNSLALDSCRNVYITGKSYNGTNYDYSTIKYEPQ